MECKDARINNFYISYGESEITEEGLMSAFAEFLFKLGTNMNYNNESSEQKNRSENE